MRWICILVGAGAACRHRHGRGAQRDAAGLCEDYCPRRVTCVGDGFANERRRWCARAMCVRRGALRAGNACGEASFALLECMAALTCEELPLAVDALAQGDEAAGCYAEQVEQRELCTFWIEH
jgi:hypothetical protein